MILPIYVYGSPVLKKKAVEIDSSYPNLQELIANMFETMVKADGVGLAAPQVGLSIRLIVIDALPMAEDSPELKDFKIVIINPEIIEEDGDEWAYNEGCLSLPSVREDIKRKSKIHIKYFDENFKMHDEWFDGMKARIIQHEYDHLEGKLMVDKFSQLKKRLMNRKLEDITKGKTTANYKISFPVK